MKNLCLLAAAFLAVLLFPAVSNATTAGYSDLVRWCTSQMQVWSPPGHSQFPGAQESESEGAARYAVIARDAISVAFDPDEAPIYPGPDGRSRTLATILAIADSESGFRKDVENGIGKASRGDGNSWCMMQIQLSPENPKTHTTHTRVLLDGDGWAYSFDGENGWTGEDLVQDRKKCFRMGLHMIRVSFRSCRYLPLRDRLSVYTGGSCSAPKARATSEVRMGKAISWLFRNPALADDSTVAAWVYLDPYPFQGEFLTSQNTSTFD